MSTELAIACKDLCMKYGRHQVLRGVDLGIPTGSIFALLGTNGAGKTTLIRTLLGLLPRGGGVSVLGEDPWVAGAALRQRIGYVSEEQGLYGWMSVAQLIEFCRGLYDRWNQDLVADYLRRFSLPPQKRIGTMSKGQKVRLALILSLAPEPELLILDEPMSGLDPLAQYQFLRIIQEVAVTRDRTIFFSTHNLTDVEAIATHVAILDEGVIKITGTMAEVRASVRRLQVPRAEGGSPPYPAALLLDTDAATATYLIPNAPGMAESAAAGQAMRGKVDEATLADVFLYFCARGRDNADGFVSAS
ncbi:MAG: ABC transporter ATP-binding protein [Bacteroidota bacterium]